MTTPDPTGTSKGYVGFRVDPTTEANYTDAGVDANAPEPENDPTAAAAAKAVTDPGPGNAQGV